MRSFANNAREGACRQGQTLDVIVVGCATMQVMLEMPVRSYIADMRGTSRPSMLRAFRHAPLVQSP